MKFGLWGVFYLAWRRGVKYLDAEASLGQAGCRSSRDFCPGMRIVISRSLRAKEKMLCFNLSPSTELCQSSLGKCKDRRFYCEANG